MKKLVLAACLGLGACASYPEVAVTTPTAIQIITPPAQQQAAENLAQRHCAASHTVPRLTLQSFAGNDLMVGPVMSYRYECEQTPVAVAKP